MSEAAVPGATQMSPRARKRFLIGLSAMVVLLFFGGMAAWALDFSHKQVCPGGKHWIAQGNDSMGAVTYLCPNGLTVTQGIAPYIGRLMREWWIRTVLVLSAPRAVFAALRDDSNESAALRSEPALLIVWLAGMAFVLSTRTAAHLMDGVDGYDPLLVAVWTFLAGGLYGGIFYWLLGGVLHRVSLLLGSQGSYRRARHVLAFATVPVALSLALLPFKLAAYGSALFHEGGPDSGTGGKVFEALGIAFLVWSACLLVIGVRTVHGWSVGRALAAAAAPIVLAGAFLLF